MDKRTKLLVVLGAVVLLVMGGLGLLTLLQRSGKTAVNIVVYPNDATITINDRSANSGTVYLAPGEYIFKATRPGWQEVTERRTIAQESTTVTLLPEPETTEALEWLEQNTREVYEREGAAGQKANEEGYQLYLKNQIIMKLPYEGDNFEITYNETDQSASGVEVMVIATTPAGRTAALKQMRDWGYDPSDMQVRYVGFTNPLGGTQ